MHIDFIFCKLHGPDIFLLTNDLMQYHETLSVLRMFLSWPDCDWTNVNVLSYKSYLPLFKES